MQLYTDGAQAFVRIRDCIRMAQKSIRINMFIWRDDKIGNLLASELLTAADRGVRIRLSLDLAGGWFEYAEESRRSLFHPRLCPFHRFRVWVLSVGNGPPGRPTGIEHPLAEQLLRHPNVVLDRDLVKNDHSKFYIFDDNRLIFGGVNIEDKENGLDSRGIPYKDYMLETEDPAIVAAFLRKWDRLEDLPGDPSFVVNRKHPLRCFEIGDEYIRLIEESRESVTIVMAYINSMTRLQKPLLRAARRGVDVRILLPGSANYQDAANKLTVQRLMRKSSGRIRVFFSPMMLHIKLMLCDDVVFTGSFNLTRRSDRFLDELNVKTRDPQLFAALRTDAEALLQQAREVCHWRDIRFSRTRALLEWLLS